ncbi:MAG: VanZ family protein [Bacteroidales bacterium]|nr:VanZ family protein [Bacteroidales bacterium]
MLDLFSGIFILFMQNEYKKTYKTLSVVLFVLWVVVMFVMLLLPNDLLQQNRTSLFKIPHSDKIMHCGLFGVFTFLLQTLLLLNIKLKTKKQYLLTAILSVSFGLFTEFLQALTYQWCGRRFELSDYLSDIIGVVLALLLFILFEKKLKKRLQNEK